ncbi:hypothetical protein P8452_28948 [Trifolium repens]|nr:hypothetical protein P8452_28948 [Trifolium repens]
MSLHLSLTHTHQHSPFLFHFSPQTKSTAESNCPIHKPNPTYLSAIDSVFRALFVVLFCLGVRKAVVVVFSAPSEGWRWFCFRRRWWWFCFLFPATVVVLFSVSGDGGGGSVPLRLGTVISSLLSQTN